MSAWVTRCSSASVPTRISVDSEDQSGCTSPSTSNAARPAAEASSFTRRRVPGRRFENDIPLQCEQSNGRCDPHFAQNKSPSSGCDTNDSHCSQIASSRHDLHASKREVPVRLMTHNTRRDESRSSSITADESLPIPGPSSSERSATTTPGHPADSRT